LKTITVDFPNHGDLDISNNLAAQELKNIVGFLESIFNFLFTSIFNFPYSILSLFSASLEEPISWLF
jgi:4-hydroxyphenylpyruvate dioxygenase-like putative hemolysin